MSKPCFDKILTIISWDSIKGINIIKLFINFKEIDCLKTLSHNILLLNYFLKNKKLTLKYVIFSSLETEFYLFLIIKLKILRTKFPSILEV